MDADEILNEYLVLSMADPRIQDVMVQLVKESSYQHIETELRSALDQYRWSTMSKHGLSMPGNNDPANMTSDATFNSSDPGHNTETELTLSGGKSEPFQHSVSGPDDNDAHPDYVSSQGQPAPGQYGAIPGGQPTLGQCGAVSGGQTAPGQCGAVSGGHTAPGQCGAVSGGQTAPGQCGAVSGGQTALGQCGAVSGRQTAPGPCGAVRGGQTALGQCGVVTGAQTALCQCGAVIGDTTIDSLLKDSRSHGYSKQDLLRMAVGIIGQKYICLAEKGKNSGKPSACNCHGIEQFSLDHKGEDLPNNQHGGLLKFRMKPPTADLDVYEGDTEWCSDSSSSTSQDPSSLDEGVFLSNSDNSLLSSSGRRPFEDAVVVYEGNSVRCSDGHVEDTCDRILDQAKDRDDAMDDNGQDSSSIVIAENTSLKEHLRQYCIAKGIRPQFIGDLYLERLTNAHQTAAEIKARRPARYPDMLMDDASEGHDMKQFYLDGKDESLQNGINGSGLKCHTNPSTAELDVYEADTEGCSDDPRSTSVRGDVDPYSLDENGEHYRVNENGDSLLQKNEQVLHADNFLNWCEVDKSTDIIKEASEDHHVEQFSADDKDEESLPNTHNESIFGKPPAADLDVYDADTEGCSDVSSSTSVCPSSLDEGVFLSNSDNSILNSSDKPSFEAPAVYEGDSERCSDVLVDKFDDILDQTKEGTPQSEQTTCLEIPSFENPAMFEVNSESCSDVLDNKFSHTLDQAKQVTPQLEQTTSSEKPSFEDPAMLEGDSEWCSDFLEDKFDHILDQAKEGTPQLEQTTSLEKPSFEDAEVYDGDSESCSDVLEDTFDILDQTKEVTSHSEQTLSSPERDVSLEDNTPISISSVIADKEALKGVLRQSCIAKGMRPQFIGDLYLERLANAHQTAAEIKARKPEPRVMIDKPVHLDTDLMYAVRRGLKSSLPLLVEKNKLPALMMMADGMFEEMSLDRDLDELAWPFDPLAELKESGLGMVDYMDRSATDGTSKTTVQPTGTTLCPTEDALAPLLTGGVSVSKGGINSEDSPNSNISTTTETKEPLLTITEQPAEISLSRDHTQDGNHSIRTVNTAESDMTPEDSESPADFSESDICSTSEDAEEAEAGTTDETQDLMQPDEIELTSGEHPPLSGHPLLDDNLSDNIDLLSEDYALGLKDSASSLDDTLGIATDPDGYADRSTTNSQDEDDRSDKVPSMASINVQQDTTTINDDHTPVPSTVHLFEKVAFEDEEDHSQTDDGEEITNGVEMSGYGDHVKTKTVHVDRIAQKIQVDIKSRVNMFETMSKFSDKSIPTLTRRVRAAGGRPLDRSKIAFFEQVFKY